MNNRMTGAHEWAHWILTTRYLTNVERRAARAWFVDTYGVTIENVIFGRAA